MAGDARQIVIFANERVGYKTVERMIDSGFPIAAVFTSVETRRPLIADYKDFAPLSERNGDIDFHFIESPKDPAVVAAVRGYNPHVIVVASWSQIIPGEILETPPGGTIGVHYSMLPARRGGAPLVWAIIDGLTSVGLSLFYYDEGIDTGDVIDQVAVEIDFEDTVKTMLDKIENVFPDLVIRNLPAVMDGTAPRIKQDETLASYTPPRKPADGWLDLSKGETDLYNFVRAQTEPYPCAFSHLIDQNGVKRKVVVPRARIESGRLVFEGILAPVGDEEGKAS